MTVLMTMRVHASGDRLEKAAAGHPEDLRAIVSTAAKHGLISHRFWGSGTDVMVVDEWPTQQDFEAFFAEERERIGKLMAEAGISGEPEISYWRHLETGDDFG